MNEETEKEIKEYIKEQRERGEREDDEKRERTKRLDKWYIGMSIWFLILAILYVVGGINRNIKIDKKTKENEQKIIKIAEEKRELSERIAEEKRELSERIAEEKREIVEKQKAESRAAIKRIRALEAERKQILEEAGLPYTPKPESYFSDD